MQNAYESSFKDLAIFAKACVNDDIAQETLTVATATLNALQANSFIAVSDRQWRLTLKGATEMSSMYAAAKSCEYVDTTIEAIGFAIPAFLTGLFSVTKEIAAQANDHNLKVIYPEPVNGSIYTMNDLEDATRHSCTWMSHLLPQVEDIIADTELVIRDETMSPFYGTNLSNLALQIARRVEGLPVILAKAADVTHQSASVIDLQVTAIFNSEKYEDADYKFMLAGYICGLLA